MAKITKRYYRRNRFRRFKNMISKYHATKLTYVDNIRLATNELKFVKQDAARARIGDLVALCPDFTAYKAIFLSYKVTGIKITVTPQYPLANFDMRSAVMLGITAASDDETASNVAESNKSLILRNVQKFKNCIEPLVKFSSKLPDHPMLAPAARCIWQRFQVHCFFDIIFYIFNIVYIFKINIILIIYLSCIFKHNIKIKHY